MAVKVIRKFRLLLDVVWGAPNDGDVPIYDSIQDKLVMGPQTGGGGGGAPTTADYLVGTANAGLSNEIVVGAAPGGELGGTWAAPTVDATHSGSSHAAVQAAAEATAAAALTAHINDPADAHTAAAIQNIPAGGIAAGTVQAAINELDSEKAAASHTHSGADITSGTVAEARIDATIARDAEVTAAISASEAGQVRDGDAAGGVLSGTYPNPGFASDMATQAELDAHVNDATDAHDASAISIADAANDFTATDVEGALAELQSDHEADAQALADHLADATAAHAASAISVLDTAANFTGTDVEAVLAELQDNIDAVGGITTFSVPIDLRNPRSTSLGGNSFFNVRGLTDWDAGLWEFVQDVEGKIYGIVQVPVGYSGSPVIRLALAANATTGVTRMQVATKAVADGESLNPTLTDETAQDITMPGTAYLREDATFSIAGETLAAGDILIVEIFHDGDHANDTLATNTLLVGAWLEGNL